MNAIKNKSISLSESFKNLSTYMEDKESSDEFSSESEIVEILKLMGFSPWFSFNLDKEFDQNNDVWIHPKGLCANIQRASNSFLLIALTSQFNSDWMSSKRSSFSFTIEHGYSIRVMTVNISDYDDLNLLCSQQKALKEVLPLNKWTLETIKKIEGEFVSDLQKETSVFRASLLDLQKETSVFRISLSESFIQNPLHKLSKLTQQYCKKYGASLHKQVGRDPDVFLNESVQSVLSKYIPHWFNDAEFPVFVRKKVQFLSEYLHGTSSTSSKEVEVFCEENNCPVSPLLLWLDLYCKLSFKIPPLPETQDFLKTIVEPRIKSICSELNEEQIQKFWKNDELGKDFLFDGFFKGCNYLDGLSFLLKQFRAKSELSFLNQDIFNFSTLFEYEGDYVKSLNGINVINSNLINEYKIIEFCQQNPEFLKEGTSNQFKKFLLDLEQHKMCDSTNILFESLDKVFKQIQIKENFAKNSVSKSKPLRF